MNKVLIKKGKESVAVDCRFLAEAIEKGLNLSGQIKQLREELEVITKYLKGAARDNLDREGTVSFVYNGAIAKAVFGYECIVPDCNVGKVREILGDRYEDLVVEKTTYKGTRKLIDMAADGDKGKRIAGLLVISEKGPSVTFCAEKKE